MLLTGNRFNPQALQPPVQLSDVSDPRSLLTFLQAQQQVIKTLTAALATVINASSGVGLLTDRPPPGNAGNFFFATDANHLYEDNGSTWVTWV